jgi:hypothetical protein
MKSYLKNSNGFGFRRPKTFYLSKKSFKNNDALLK